MLGVGMKIVFVDLRIYKAFLHTTRGTNGTRRRTSIENGRYDVLITTRVTEQIMENLRPRSVASAPPTGGANTSRSLTRREGERAVTHRRCR